MSERKPAVTVIGLGPMGRAMVRVLLAGGHPVTVWNRTASRARAAEAEGATLAADPAEALAASELVILSLTDYRAMYDILGGDGVGDALRGRVVANLSSDTPEQTRRAADWLAERGARFLAGGVMAPEPLVGTDAAYVFYSGPREVFDAHRDTLAAIGRPDYVGADPGRAQLYYQAQLDIFLTSLSAYLHASALLAAEGVTATEFVPWAADNFDGISAYLPEAARCIDSGDHPGEKATSTMMGATAAHILDASRAAGIDLELPTAVKSHYDRAIAAGHGADSWTALVEVIRKG
ncbi:NAD(P)-dependent oxidoreductase [Pseudonocardia acaciae]|uniref:NAD(P)-dependent oxidoreductase n=1 Tax=Pseudonocardia acaciae TaxID=551276 RepID=UPI00048C884D|nr:NAD(P)-binding domain-containing protein [Pseudonocardia acaciae]